MSNHTKGPWRKRQHGDANHHFIEQPSGRWLAVVQQNGELSAAEEEANIDLMVAATNMLAALKKAVSEMDGQKVAMSWIDDARAAIAKAEGKDNA